MLLDFLPRAIWLWGVANATFFPPFFSLSLFQKVCTKCGIETFGAQKRPLWLCKICSEQREVKYSCGEMGLSSMYLPGSSLCWVCVCSSLCLDTWRGAWDGVWELWPEARQAQWIHTMVTTLVYEEVEGKKPHEPLQPVCLCGIFVAMVIKRLLPSAAVLFPS